MHCSYYTGKLLKIIGHIVCGNYCKKNQWQFFEDKCCKISVGELRISIEEAW
jgi:hypothetical protein